jgi:hypothetical protein
MKTIDELKKTIVKVLKTFYTIWTGIDILFIVLLTLAMIIYQPIIRIFTILVIIMAICYEIGKFYDKYFV